MSGRVGLIPGKSKAGWAFAPRRRAGEAPGPRLSYYRSLA